MPKFIHPMGAALILWLHFLKDQRVLTLLTLTKMSFSALQEILSNATSTVQEAIVGTLSLPCPTLIQEPQVLNF
jgi:hypothetical protein